MNQNHIDDIWHGCKKYEFLTSQNWLIIWNVEKWCSIPRPKFLFKYFVPFSHNETVNSTKKNPFNFFPSPNKCYRFKIISHVLICWSKNNFLNYYKCKFGFGCVEIEHVFQIDSTVTVHNWAAKRFKHNVFKTSRINLYMVNMIPIKRKYKIQN